MKKKLCRQQKTEINLKKAVKMVKNPLNFYIYNNKTYLSKPNFDAILSRDDPVELWKTSSKPPDEHQLVHRPMQSPYQNHPSCTNLPAHYPRDF